MDTTLHALYAAVDLGAGSGRVMLGGVAPGELLLREVRRFHYPMERRDGHLRWPFPHILHEIEAGLREAATAAGALGRPLRSVGVDSWAVDYGFLDAEGTLLEDPICYRDERTEGSIEAVSALVGRDRLFERTGIQFLPFNTIFQLWAHGRAGLPKRAVRLLMIPDLIHHALTGRAVTEYTNATTTQLYGARTPGWDPELAGAIGLPIALLPEVVAAGTDLGPVRPSVAEALGLTGTRVVAPATHDTGSAVAGAPLKDGWAYISSGTWSLVGVERTEPLVSPAVAAENFTNEGGAYGTVRFLKNVMGLWLLESCRKEWQAAGHDVAHETLLARAAAYAEPPALIFPDDPRFLNPGSMTGAIAEQLRESGGDVPADPAAITCTILASLAFRYASVLRTIEALTGGRIGGVHVVGGGGRNELLNQMTADASGIEVLAGPVEATAMGNLLVQAIAAGRFASLAEARRHVAENVRPNRFLPRPPPGWESARGRYEAIEARFTARPG